ncbi:MAG: polysaccharide deacetylase family protein [Lautropia sp.]
MQAGNPGDDRPLASVSLDLDNLWSYLKVHGDDGWQQRPSYFDTFAPYVCELLDAVGAKITFFIVGVDAADPKNGAALRSLVANGHELGNHSLEHEPWLHLYTREQLEREIRETGRAIFEATGVRVDGFRGPGFSWCPELLEVLADEGYRYDASTLPSYLGPLARAYYFWSSGLSKAERAQRKDLFGRFVDGLRPVKPYRWQLREGRQLLEIPVTTMPVFKVPFHFSYLAYLARFSEVLMWRYLDVALAMCRVTGTEPSFLLHPLDMMGGDRVPELKFFPGMDLPSARKAALLSAVLRKIGRRYRIVTMGAHARAIAARQGLSLRFAA